MDIKTLLPFANAMADKFKAKEKEGYTGWDNPEECNNDLLLKSLHKNIEDGDWVDVANIAAILWHRATFGLSPARKQEGDAHDQ